MSADRIAMVVDQLEAERLIGSRDETPADPLMELIAALDRMLTNPGPPDRARSALPPSPPERQETTT